MLTADSLEKSLMLGMVEGRGHQRRRLDGITYAMDVNLDKLGNGEGQGGLACYSPWGHKESVRHDWETEQPRGLASSESP